ncbi:MAG: hypothetical protein ACC628_14235 [Pirellulaceae bacterium]
MSRILATVLLLLFGVLRQGLARELLVEQKTDSLATPETVALASPQLPPMIAPAPTPMAPSGAPALPPARYYDRYDRPRDAVHRNAAWKAARRRERIAARRAMGYSPQRPSPWAFMGGHSSWSIIRPPLYIPAVIIGPMQPTMVIGGPTGLGGY